MASTLVLASGNSSIKGIEDALNGFVAPATKIIGDIVFKPVPIGETEFPVVVIWLVLGGLIFTIMTRGLQVRGIKYSFELIRGKWSTAKDPGEITHFQALASALSGTVGLGNIAGVAVAVTTGGPGATFWMILAGILGMCTKFMECTLGVKYRQFNEDGSVSGGPFKYLPIAYGKTRRFIGDTGSKILGGVMTTIFAISIFFFGMFGGNMLQSNQTFAQLRNVTGGTEGPLGSVTASFIFGVALAVLIGIVIIGGVKSIGKVTDKLVPFMGILYITACLIVIAISYAKIPAAIGSIFTGAFSPDGVTGGALGVLIIGFQRAAFSNEAGVGSAPIVHSAVKTRRPVSEGFVALLEPFFDTVVVCTMTALTIVIASPAGYVASRAEVAAGQDPSRSGVLITSDAFAEVLPWFPTVLAVAVALFAFSTLLTWSYYTQKAFEFVFGHSQLSTRVFQAIFLLFTIAGAMLTLGDLFDLADAMLFICSIVNIAGLYIMAPVVLKEMREWIADRKSGRLAQENEEFLASVDA